MVMLNYRRRTKSNLSLDVNHDQNRPVSPAVTYPILMQRIFLKVLIHRKVIAGAIFFAMIYIELREVMSMQMHTKTGESTSHPIVIGCYFDGTTNKINRIRRLPIHDEDKYPSKRQVEWTPEDEQFHKKLRDSRKYNENRAEENRDKTCSLPHKWQKEAHPTCNVLQETDFSSFFAETSTMARENMRMVAHGFWRDVWKIRDAGTQEWIASKTLRFKHQFTDRNFDRHLRDAIATDRTTSSPDILDMFAFCGHSVLTDFSNEGTLSELIWPETGKSKLSMRERLDLALKIARAVAAVHFPDGSNTPSIVHSDITPSQFLFIDGNLKLNDFNRCRFLARRNDNTVCSFRISNNPGKLRSPEEYVYSMENEKIDVYSMGNVFYSLLTELWPFQDAKEEDAQRSVVAGKHPSIPEMNVTEPVKILISAMKMCWTHEQRDRPSSKEILRYLEKEIDSLT